MRKINKNKKYTIPKGKKYLIKSQGKVIKLYNSFKDQNNNINDNYKSLSIKEISNLQRLKINLDYLFYYLYRQYYS